nr:Ca2+ sensor (EF-Hand superfamily) [Ipomoea batatas]
MGDLTRAAKHYFGSDYDKYKQEAEKTRKLSVEELYIREAKISIRKCNACREILAGFYFCCIECEFYDGYSLCVNCFYDGTVKHQHDSFADNHSILTMVKKGSRNPPCEIHKDKGKAKQDLQIVAIKPYCTSPPAETMILEGRKMVDNEGMDKLARIAKAHHKAASREIKNAADTFCRNMFRQAGNGQSRLTQNDYLAVMIKMRYPQYADRELFQMLAKDGNHMTMSEALTLYYIVLSGRPFCSGCEHFIPDMFFCCSKCPAAKYALCLGCYESEAYLRHKRNKHFGENDLRDMEDLREAAKYYLEGASEEYKQRARRAMAAGESLEDFYVRETKRCIRRCDVCAKLLLGFYLCCTKCELYKGSNYNLCVKCFYGRTFQHNHDSFADNHSVLTMHNEGRGEPTCVIEKDKGKSKQDSNSIRHLSSSKDSSSHSNSIRQVLSSHHSNLMHHVSSSHSNSIRHVSSSHSNSIRHVSSSHSNSIRHVSSSHSNSIRHVSNSHSNSIRHVSSNHSNSLRRNTPDSTDSSHSKSIIPVPNLRDSSHSNSLRRSISGSTDSSQSNSIRLSLRKIMIDKEGIEKLAYIAQAHYNAAPQKIRDSADKFFWSMVKQRGKTRVTMEDFVESMKEKRYPEYAHPDLFQILVKDRNLGMDITESRTLYYIVLTGKPFCNWCNCFIPDLYFCCSKCSARSYALCLHCYSTKAYVKHSHYTDDDVFFLDYSVLHTTIQATSVENGSSKAIVERNMGDKLVAGWNVCKAILNAGGTVLSIASTLGACTIM